VRLAVICLRKTPGYTALHVVTAHHIYPIIHATLTGFKHICTVYTLLYTLRH
jgi:hypothetical protein